VSAWIAGLGSHLPDRVMTAAELGERAGIPEAVVVEKMGLREKRIAGDGEHVSDMAAAAGRRALEDAAEALGETIAAEDVDGIVYCGSPHKEYPVWLAAPRIQHLLGARRAWAFEVAAVSAGVPFGLRVAADMMAADAGLRTLLLVAASRESHLIDYGLGDTRFIFNFGDGAAAAVLRRGRGRGEVLRSSFLTDGAFSEHVRVRAGGSALPASPETVATGLHALEVHDLESMRKGLDPVTLDRFVEVARGAAEASGWGREGIDFLAVLHTKRSLHDAILDRLGLTEDRSIYLDDLGHVSAADPLFTLERAARAGRLTDGMRVMTLSAGTGYSWAATAIRWGAE
jgi:3-oxoacyl-[acyl-carrier-protein] synthase III